MIKPPFLIFIIITSVYLKFVSSLKVIVVGAGVSGLSAAI